MHIQKLGHSNDTSVNHILTYHHNKSRLYRDFAYPSILCTYLVIQLAGLSYS